MNNAIRWLSEHPTVVIVLLVCIAAVLAVAILAGRDVMVFFRWFAGLFGLGS